MNKGLSEVLKKAFPNSEPVPRPKTVLETTLHPSWLAGFVDGEGCFYIAVIKSKSSSTGFRVKLTFSISQHSRDEPLLSKISDYLGCGNLEKPDTRPTVVTFVTY